MIRNIDQSFYSTNGYLVLPGLFAPEECNRIVSILKKYTDETFRGQMNVDRKDPEIKKLVHDSRIYSAVERLYGVPMGYLATQILYKEPGSPFAKHAWNPHQDNFYVGAPDHGHCSATVILEDSTPENGGVYFYPGSNWEPVLEHEHHPSFDPNQNPGAKIKKIPPQYRRVDVWMKKGDLLIHHGQVIHGSTANLSNRGRYHFGISCVIKGGSFSLGGQNSQREFRLFHE